MIADFEDFVTWMFVTIDDLWQKIAPMYDRPGPDPTSCSDREADLFNCPVVGTLSP